MRPANDALKSAGLNLHKPLPMTIGASNERVFTLINCENHGGDKLVPLDPNRDGDRVEG